MIIEPLIDGSAAAIKRLRLLEGRHAQGGSVERDVVAIIAGVRRGGDRAVARYTRKFDGVTLAADDFEVGRDEIAEALASLPASLRAALRAAHRRIVAFHKPQLARGYELREGDTRNSVRVLPLARVGVYAPGGRAAYPSTVLMNVVPARVAGVDEVVMATPPGPGGTVEPAVLAAAAIAGVDRIFRVGGAQAIAALALGTDSIARVDKIVGPGNIYVATAKRLLFGQVDIDMIAGPTEVLVIADGSARADYVAADMLAQAEHDPLAASVCITSSQRTAAAVAKQLESQLGGLERRTIAAASLKKYGSILVVKSLARAVDLANEIAPEHVEVMTAAPRKLLGGLRNAGAIFLGAMSSEPFGDYAAGPNHVLPTGGSARFASPLGVYDFVKRSSIIDMGVGGVRAIGPTVLRLAEAEGLTAHAAAVRLRLDDVAGKPAAKKKQRSGSGRKGGR
jgi:histidinol dehydrogenase